MGFALVRGGAGGGGRKEGAVLGLASAERLEKAVGLTTKSAESA
jgi:hypothetical protein